MPQVRNLALDKMTVPTFAIHCCGKLLTVTSSLVFFFLVRIALLWHAKKKLPCINLFFRPSFMNWNLCIRPTVLHAWCILVHSCMHDVFFYIDFLFFFFLVVFSVDVPKDQRLQAIKAAIMLLPDENREVLQTLLYFLSDVAAAVDENQMTPTNLAVCLAPSLFHLNTLKRENSSPRYVYSNFLSICPAMYFGSLFPQNGCLQ